MNLSLDIEYTKAMKIYKKLLYNINKLGRYTYNIYIIYVSVLFHFVGAI